MAVKGKQDLRGQPGNQCSPGNIYRGPVVPVPEYEVYATGRGAEWKGIEMVHDTFSSPGIFDNTT